MATGGSDGTVAVWDHRAKKRIKLYNRLPTAISALAFSSDGTRLAIGVSSMQDFRSDERKEELVNTGDDPNHVSIVVKTVGAELKVSSSLGFRTSISYRYRVPQGFHIAKAI